ncbi:MAG: hypothetical protein ABSF90_25835 [Syntrophobacteraceae bacterium]
MANFKEFPKGTIRRNHNFYGEAFLAAIIILLGSHIVATGRFTNRVGTLVCEGEPAIFLGILFICFGLYILYYLFFKAEAEELKLGDFHELNDFEDIVDGYKTKFTVGNTVTVAGTSCPSVFYYRLEIRFNQELNIGLNIKQRDRVEHFLWLIGVTRFFDVHTLSRHFDSQYRVKCSNTGLFQFIYDADIIRMLEEFDRDYPPIRKKNGILHITDAFFRYVEGPYSEDSRIFDPHRGKIEDLFRELIQIMRKIEHNNAMINLKGNETLTSVKPDATHYDNTI